MQDILLGIWEDLRAKRLLPVAVLLLVGIVAIPVLMTKSAETPALPDPAASVTVPPVGPTVQLDTADAESSGKGSQLDVFSAKDPFAPPKSVTASAKAAAGADSAAGASSDDTAGAGGGAPSTGGGDTGGESAPTPGKPETSEYEYVADVTFWDGNRRRRIEGLRKLDMLPSQSSPVLIFMGTTNGGGNAVFLVDSTLETAGEGSCAPSPSNCAFVRIGPGAEHTFTTAEGDSYRLRVDEIRRVDASASASLAGPTARTSVGSETDAAGDPFDLPSLVDLVVETEPAPPAETAPENGSSIEPASR